MNLTCLFLALTLEVIETVAIVSSVAFYVIPLRLQLHDTRQQLHKNQRKIQEQMFKKVKPKECEIEAEERTMVTTREWFQNRERERELFNSREGVAYKP